MTGLGSCGLWVMNLFLVQWDLHWRIPAESNWYIQEEINLDLFLNIWTI